MVETRGGSDVRKGPRSEGCRRPQKLRKAEISFSPEPSRRSTAPNTDLAPEDELCASPERQE